MDNDFNILIYAIIGILIANFALAGLGKFFAAKKKPSKHGKEPGKEGEANVSRNRTLAMFFFLLLIVIDVVFFLWFMTTGKEILMGIFDLSFIM